MGDALPRRALLAAGLAFGIAAPAFADKASNTLRLAAIQPVETVAYYFDPSPDTVFESEAIYDDLVSYDVKRGEFEPLLAKSWTRTSPTTLEFELRDGIAWQDGQPFTAADVVDTLNWLADPNVPLRFKQDWSWIKSAEALSPTRIRVEARQPSPFDLMRFAYVTAIMPRHQALPFAEKGREPIGTGPYRAVSLDSAKGIVLERNPAFHQGNPAKPGSNIGKITIAPIPDEGSRVAELLAGNLDMIQVTWATAQNLRSDPRFEVSLVEGGGFMYVAFDAAGRSGAKPATDERVRRALAMAIDKPGLLSLVAGGATLPEPGSMCWRAQQGCDYSAPLPPYDATAAKKLLADAGYPDGFDIEITTFTGPPSEIAEAVAGQWEKVGVRAKIDALPLVAYRKKQAAGKIQVMVAAWPAGNIPDVSGTVDGFFGAGPDDYSGDATLHALAAQSDAAMDPAERKAIGRTMFDRATDEVYFVPIAPYPSVLVHTHEVAVSEGGRFTPMGFDVSDLRWK